MMRVIGRGLSPCQSSRPPRPLFCETILRKRVVEVRAGDAGEGGGGGGGAKGAGGARIDWSVGVVREKDGESGTGFVKPLSELYPRLPCRYCKGVGEVVCDKCTGEGKLAKGGYHRKNPVDVDRIVGSKWTAMQTTFGWRHFRVHSKRRGSGKDWFVEMSATCDETARFWVNIKNLKERERWSMGWLQKVEILAAQNNESKSKLVCKACKGKGRIPCSCMFRDSEELILDIIEDLNGRTLLAKIGAETNRSAKEEQDSRPCRPPLSLQI